MKHSLLTIALLLMLAPLGAKAQSFLTKETFANPVSHIVVANNASLDIHFISSGMNCITSAPASDTDSSDITYYNGTLTLRNRRNAELSLVYSPCLVVEGKDMAIVTIHCNNDTLKSLETKCFDNSMISIEGSGAVMNRIVFNAQDNSHLSYKATCFADVLTGQTWDNANVSFDNISGNNLQLTSSGNSNITIADGIWEFAEGTLSDASNIQFDCSVNKKSLTWTGYSFGDIPIEVEYENSTAKVPPFSFNLLLGFHNWAKKQGYFCIAETNGYQIDTRLGAFQAELNFNLLRSKRIWMGLGVGYSRNRYRFSTQNPLNMYPELTDLDVYSNTSHYLTTHFITVPVHLTLRLHKSLQIGVAAVPGFNPRYRNDIFLAENNSYNQQNVLYTHHDLLNPYRCDLRLTLGSPHWGAYLQMATTPLFNRTNTKIYPIEAGLILHIF